MAANAATAWANGEKVQLDIVSLMSENITEKEKELVGYTNDEIIVQSFFLFLLDLMLQPLPFNFSFKYFITTVEWMILEVPYVKLYSTLSNFCYDRLHRYLLTIVFI